MYGYMLLNLSPSPNLYKVQSVYNNNITSGSLHEELKTMFIDYKQTIYMNTKSTVQSYAVYASHSHPQLVSQTQSHACKNIALQLKLSTCLRVTTKLNIAFTTWTVTMEKHIVYVLLVLHSGSYTCTNNI